MCKHMQFLGKPLPFLFGGVGGPADQWLRMVTVMCVFVCLCVSLYLFDWFRYSKVPVAPRHLATPLGADVVPPASPQIQSTPLLSSNSAHYIVVRRYGTRRGCHFFENNIAILGCSHLNWRTGQLSSHLTGALAERLHGTHLCFAEFGRTPLYIARAKLNASACLLTVVDPTGVPSPALVFNVHTKSTQSVAPIRKYCSFRTPLVT